MRPLEPLPSLDHHDFQAVQMAVADKVQAIGAMSNRLQFIELVSMIQAVCLVLANRRMPQAVIPEFVASQILAAEKLWEVIKETKDGRRQET